MATSGESDAPGRLFRLENNGAGVFSIAQVVDVGHRPDAATVGDLDNDGVPEVAVRFTHTSNDHDLYLEPNVAVFENDGDGVLSVHQEVVNPLVRLGRLLHTADVNSDGYLDLIAADGMGGPRVYLNQGDGTFDKGVTYDALGPAGGQAVADFTGDGRVDVTTMPAVSVGLLTLLVNASCPPCAADFNGDGALNILDFVAFQAAWQTGDEQADCDDNGLFTIVDFVCFQQAFQAGCPS